MLFRARGLGGGGGCLELRVGAAFRGEEATGPRGLVIVSFLICLFFVGGGGGGGRREIQSLGLYAFREAKSFEFEVFTV